MERNRLVTRDPGRPRSPAAHAAILTAAIALVREVGFDAVSIEAIAVRAGVGKATIYRRWDGKETLVAEAITHLMSSAMHPPDTGTTRGDVTALMRITKGMYADPATPLLLSGLVAAMARSEPIAQAVRGGFVASWRNAMRVVLKRGIARGDLRQIDIELATDLLAGAALHRSLIGGKRIDDRFMRGVVDVVLRGLQPDNSEDTDDLES